VKNLRTGLDVIKKVFTESPEMCLDVIMGNPRTEKMLDIDREAPDDIRAKIKPGERTKSLETIEKAVKKIYGSKDQ
jgi:hypothetical protein